MLGLYRILGFQRVAGNFTGMLCIYATLMYWFLEYICV